jgi:hypothetical protein
MPPCAICCTIWYRPNVSVIVRPPYRAVDPVDGPDPGRCGRRRTLTLRGPVPESPPTPSKDDEDAVDNAQRQALMTGFNNVLRTSTLAGQVDFQRTSLAFAALLQHLPDDAASVPLEPIYDFLKEQKAPEAGIREVILFFQSREARFGVRLELPAVLLRLGEEERARIVMAVASRGQTSGTNAGVGGGVSGPHAAAPGPAPEVQAPSPTRSADPDFVAEAKAAKKNPGAPRRRLLVALAVLAVVFVGDLVASTVFAEPPPAPFELNDPAGLPCQQSTKVQTTFVCRVPRAFLDATSRDEILKRGQVTKTLAQARGITSVVVFRLEDNALQWSF